MGRIQYVILVLLSLFFLTSCEESSVNETPFGSVSGRVVSATTGNPLASATVYIADHQSTTQVQTDTNGLFSIVDIPVGSYTLVAELSNYTNDELIVAVPGNANLDDQNLSLLPLTFADGKYAIVLTWAAMPRDLDSHLYVPDGAPFREIFYGDLGDSDGTLNTAPYASLDLDDTDGEGPETITIKKSGALTYYNGTYRYFVHNWSGDEVLTNSNATVKVFDDGVLIKTYNIPTTGTGEYWHVFDLNGSTLIDFNVIEASVPATP
jgi:hypothetical protein